jgi:hypothetical protein
MPVLEQWQRRENVAEVEGVEVWGILRVYFVFHQDLELALLHSNLLIFLFTI